MFSSSSPSKKDLPLFDVQHRPFPSPHPKKKEESGMKVLMYEDSDKCNHQTY